MNENFEEYRNLVQLMRSAPKASVVDGFTEKVLNGLPDPSPWLRRAAYHWIRLFYRDIHAREDGGSVCFDPRECSFYFFITSFFYLSMGCILIAGFKAIGPGISNMEWIGLQPHFNIAAAIWLFALGMALIMDGSTAIKIAKYGTLFYIFSTIFNGILMWPYPYPPYAGVFIIGFVATNAFMGIMLALAVQKTELRTE